MQKQEIMEGVFTLSGAFTPGECGRFIEITEKKGYSNAPITTSLGPVMSPGIRNNERVIVDDEKIAADLWNRFEPFVPAKQERRKSVGLNERFRFYRYHPGQRFAMHFDGAYARANGEKSFWTLLVYLNDNYEGGETRFFVRCFETGERKVITVKPELGMALAFKHAILHEGSEVISGIKYVLRTDIMYSEQ